MLRSCRHALTKTSRSYGRLASCLVTCLLSVSLSVTAMAADHAAVEPFRLQLEAPIKTWDEAIPLGNGLTGGLLWGSENTVNLSLDRGDLWDERLPELYLEDNWNYDTIRQLKAAGNQAEISRLFDHPYNHVPYPTKLPGGRLVLRLAESQRAQSFELEMRQAVGRVALSTGRLECFFSAVQPVAMIRHWGPPLTYEFLRPGGLDKLGYQPAEFGAADGLTWMVQEAALGLRYAVVVAGKRSGDQTQLAVAITSNRTDQDPLAAGKQRVREALDAGFETLLQSHRRWWDDFWSISSATIPDPRLQRHFDKLSFVWFGYGRELGVDPGRAASQAYRLPVHTRWYKATLSHNTVLVDRQSQQPAAGVLESFAAGHGDGSQAAIPHVVARCRDAYPGVQQRRLLCLLPAYLLVADVLTSDESHQYDWVFHHRGQDVHCLAADQDADFKQAFPGAEYLARTKTGVAEGPVAVQFVAPPITTHLHLAADGPTSVIVGDGVGQSVLDRVPLVMLGRRAVSTCFAAVLEPVPEGRKPTVTAVFQDTSDDQIRITVRRADCEDRVTLDADGKVTVVVDEK